MSAINPKDCFLQTKVADLRLICCPGAEELTNLIDNHLVRWANEAGIDKETFIIPAECPRFQSGDAKGLVKESVRGDDIYIVVGQGRPFQLRVAPSVPPRTGSSSGSRPAIRMALRAFSTRWKWGLIFSIMFR